MRAEGEARALVTMQAAQAEAVHLVFEAVNSSGATPEAMQYQYLQMLPKLAENPANRIIVVPADMAGLAGLATSLAQVAQGDRGAASPPSRAGNHLATGNGSSGARPQLKAADAV